MNTPIFEMQPSSYARHANYQIIAKNYLNKIMSSSSTCLLDVYVVVLHEHVKLVRP